eukprot:jgi/Botrbrau1/15023/Bobra.320_2s0003.1
MSAKRSERLRTLTLSLSQGQVPMRKRGNDAMDGHNASPEITKKDRKSLALGVHYDLRDQIISKGTTSCPSRLRPKRLAPTNVAGSTKKLRITEEEQPSSDCDGLPIKQIPGTEIQEISSPRTAAVTNRGLKVQRPLFSPSKPPLPMKRLTTSSTPEKVVGKALKQLPAHYSILGTLFGKLQEVYVLLRNRGQRCTFANMRPPVEAACHRRFTEKQLLQMKSIYPEAICLQIANMVETPSRTPKRSHGEAQLVITMPLLDGEAVRPDNASAFLAGGTKDGQGLTPQKGVLHNPVACQAEFVRRLVASLEDHCRSHLLAQGIPMKPGMSPLSTAMSSGFCLEMAPEIVGAALPQQTETPSKGSLCQSLLPSTPGTTTAPTPFSRSSVRRLHGCTAPDGVHLPIRRLSFGGGTPAKPRGNLPPCPASAELRRESMQGELPISVAALQVAEEISEARRNSECEDIKSALRHLHASGASVRCFDILRSFFGSTGPCALPYEKVLAELHRNGGCSEDDAPRVLDLLLSTIPDYLSKTQAVDGRGAMIRIARNVHSNAARLQLQNLCSKQLTPFS